MAEKYESQQCKLESNPQLNAKIDWSSVTSKCFSDRSADAFLAHTKFELTHDNKPDPRKWQPPTKGEFATDEHGYPLDPVSFYFHGSLKDLKKDFEKAGWTEAEDGDASGILQAIFDKDKWPMSDLYYPDRNGKLQTQVTGFSKDTSNDRSNRNHLRIFDTGKTDEDGRPVWAVAATRDSAYELALDRLTDPDVPIKHVTDPITDSEREYVLKTWKDHGIAADVEKMQLNFQQQNAGATSKDGIVYNVWLGEKPKGK